MKKFLLSILAALTLAIPLPATTLNGTLKYSDGRPVSGLLTLTPNERMNVLLTGGCGGPLSIVPASPPRIMLINGSPPVGTTVFGNDCISPANSFYNARLVDSTGKLVIQEAWRITGSVVNLANILPIVSPLSQPITLNGDVTGDVTQSIVSRLQGIPILAVTPTNGQILLYNGTNWAPGNTAGTGTVTQVALAAPGIFSVTGTPINSSGTLTLGLVSQTQNTVWAAPSGGNGNPAFRVLVASDIPAVPESNVTGLTADLTARALTATTVTTTAPLTGSGTLGANLTLGISSFTTGASGIVSASGAAGNILFGNNTWAPPPSSIGSVTLTAPVEFTITGSPLSSTGTLGLSWASEGQNKVFAAPSGSSGTPTFRALVASDIPAIAESGVTSLTADLAGRALTTTTLSTTLPLTGGGDLSTNRTLGINAFGPSGGSHAPGAVPDPGVSLGTTKALFEDATFKTVVTSHTIAVPAEITLSGVNPVTTSGTTTFSWSSEPQNQVFSGPAGGAGTPTFRPLVALDIPSIAESQVTNLVTDLGNKVGTSRQVLTSSPLSGGGNLSADLTLGLTLNGAGCLSASGGLGIANNCITDAMLLSSSGNLKRDGSTTLTAAWNTGAQSIGLNVVPLYGLHQLGASRRLQALASPGSPSVTPQGTTGATTYQYYVVAEDRIGGTTLPSIVGSTNTGNATLTVTNFNLVQWSPVPGAACYDVLKNDTSHSVIVCTSATQYSDTGGASSAYTTPTRNSTADDIVDGQLTAGSEVITGGVSVTGNITASTFTSTVATGTAPLTVTSTTPVSNLALAADTQLPTISTAGKVSNSATTATAVDTASTIVLRDASKNFAANQITADANFIGPLTGNVTGNVSGSAASFTGPLVGDVTGTQGATVVSLVAASTAANVHAAELLANAATAANTASAIVKRDGSGNFIAGTITATLSGNATNVTGVVLPANGGTGQTTAAAAFNALSPMNTTGDTEYESAPNTAARLAGNVASTNKFLTSLGTGVVAQAPTWNLLVAGDIPSIAESQVTNLVSDLAAKVPTTRLVATGAGLTGGGALSSDLTLSVPAGGITDAMMLNTPATINTAGAIVKRDGSGNFAAGTITGTLSGSATNFSGSLAGDVTGTQGATVVATVGASTAANVHTAELLANAATDANVVNAIVKRRTNGDFNAGTITALLVNAPSTGLQFNGTTTIDFSATPPPSAGQVLKATGVNTATWQTLTGTGTVTNIATGAGLTGGPITTTGTLSIPAAGVTDSMLATSYVKADGTRPLTANWSAGNFTIDGQNTWRVFNIIAYGADPTGVADSTTAITNAATAANAAGGGIVLVPRGVFKYSVITNPGNNVFIVGEGEGVSTLQTTTTNAATIILNGTNQGISDVAIDTSGTPASGQSLVKIDTSATSVTVRRVRFLNGMTGLLDASADGSNMRRIESVTFFPTVAAARGIWIATAKNVQIVDCLVNFGGLNGTAGIDLDFATNVSIANAHVFGTTVAGTNASRALYIHASSNTVNITGSFFNSTLLTAGPNTVDITSGSAISFSSCVFTGGVNTISVTGGGDISISSSLIALANQNGINHNASSRMTLLGTVISDCSQQTDNTYADILLGASSKYFYMVDGSSRNGVYSVTNGAKYGIQVTAGAANYFVSPEVDEQGKTAGSTGFMQTVASASTITPLSDIQFVSGTVTIQTITAPGSTQPFNRVRLIPTGLWSTNTAGNIAIVTTGVVSKVLVLEYDQASGKWYPSY